MFTKPTVFILGAGVSAPFGFPVGRQMKDAICNGGYMPSNGAYQHTLPAEQMIDLLAAALDGSVFGSHTARRFIDAFRGSDMYSIDTWLESNQEDKNLLAVGKYAISAVIMNAEARAGQGADVNQDWFAWLWNNMVTSEIEELSQNNVKFITFNYDRMLEWKLDRQIKNTYLRADQAQYQKAFREMKSKIVHAHGEIKPPNSDEDLYGFGETHFEGIRNRLSHDVERKYEIYVNCVREYSKSINIVCEKQADNALVDAAKRMLDNKSRVVILGFSFDKRNILKLDLDDFAKHRGTYGISKDVQLNLDGLPIIGTAMGVKRGERAVIENMLNNLIALGPDNMDAVEFCRSYVKST